MMFSKEALKTENAEYHLLRIIYEVGENHLSVYACRDKEPTEEMELYVAPFFNVTQASVCLGFARTEKPRGLTYANLLEYWGRKFWPTELSYLGAHGNLTKSNLILVIKAAKDRPFDLEELKPLNNLKLEDISK